MKLSTRGRYALRLMLDLALCPEGTSISLKTIAQHQELSMKYLEQIVTPLTHEGLLHAQRGAQGGYSLTMPPEDYTVGAILRTVEGDLALVPCLAPDTGVCPRQDTCVTVDVYKRVDDAIDSVVDSITLKDLVALQHEKWGGSVPPTEN